MITEALLVREDGAAFVHQDIGADDCLRDEEAFVELKVTAVCPSDLNQTKHLEKKLD